MRLTALGALLGALVLLAQAGCAKAHASETQKESPSFVERAGVIVIPQGSPLRARLTVAPVAALAIRHELEVPASTREDPARLAKISPPLAGRIVKLLVGLGDAVERGRPLFTLDSPELVDAQSDYLKAKSESAQAAHNLARQTDLHEHGVAAHKELEQAATELELANSELARASTRLRLLGMTPNDVGAPLVVRAPISGRVVELSTAPGQYQNDPASPLMTLADLSRVWVTASVPEKDIRRVSLGQSARVTFSAYPGESFSAKVAAIGEFLAPETRSVEVRVELENPAGRLKPGMFARMTLEPEAANELVVPQTAVIERGNASYVYVEKQPFAFERRAIEVGELTKDGLCITRGLTGGERIVTQNTILLP